MPVILIAYLHSNYYLNTFLILQDLIALIVN